MFVPLSFAVFWFIKGGVCVLTAKLLEDELDFFFCVCRNSVEEGFLVFFRKCAHGGGCFVEQFVVFVDYNASVFTFYHISFSGCVGSFYYLFLFLLLYLG